MPIIGVDKSAKKYLTSNTGKAFVKLAAAHGASIVATAGLMTLIGEIPGVSAAFELGKDTLPKGLGDKIAGYTTVQGYLDDLTSSGQFKAGGVGAGELMTLGIGGEMVSGSVTYELSDRDTPYLVPFVGGGIGAGLEMGYQGILSAWVVDLDSLPTSKISVAYTSVEAGGGVMGAVYMTNDRDHDLLGFAMGVDAGFGASWIVGAGRVWALRST